MKKLIFAFVLLLAVAGFYELSKTPQFNNFLFKSSSTTTSQPSPVNTTSQTITLTTNGFSPNVVTIKTGTKVIWTNNSGEEGNVSSNPHPIHTDYPPLNLGSFANGASVSLVFDKPGTYKYHNHLNPIQTGTIIVQ